jgi:hypothetical protein
MKPVTRINWKRLREEGACLTVLRKILIDRFREILDVGILCVIAPPRA